MVSNYFIPDNLDMMEPEVYRGGFYYNSNNEGELAGIFFLEKVGSKWIYHAVGKEPVQVSTDRKSIRMFCHSVDVGKLEGEMEDVMDFINLKLKEQESGT